MTSSTTNRRNAVSERERLPDRREAELVDFEHAGRRWTVTLGLSPMNVSAVFLDMPKASAIGEIGVAPL